MKKYIYLPLQKPSLAHMTPFIAASETQHFPSSLDQNFLEVSPSISMKTSAEFMKTLRREFSLQNVLCCQCMFWAK